MTDTEAGLTVLQGDDGYLVLGSERELSALTGDAAVRTNPLSPRVLSKIAVALKGTETAMAQSGRWFKADEKSAALIKEHGIKNITSAVIRNKNVPGAQGNPGSIFKHLSFQQAGVVSPAAPAVLAALAMQQALEASLADIQAYLEVIDAKLDELLKQRRTEVLGQLGGIAWAIDEAAAVFDQTGRISKVSWSKVQGNNVILATVQAECIAQLDFIAQRVRGSANDVDELAKVLGISQTDFTFWLGILARTISVQDRQYGLELAHVEDSEPEELDAHRRGIRVARQTRHERIVHALEEISASLRDVGDLSNRAKVANPFSAQKIISATNTISKEMVRFVEHADLGLMARDHLDRTSWSGAVKGLFGEAATQVSTGGAKVTGRARSLGGKVQQRREQAVLEKAEKIRARQAGAEQQSEDLDE